MQDKENLLNILKKLLNELIYIMGLQHKWSFHTVTLRITEEFNKNDLKKAVDTYFRWLKTELVKNYSIQIGSILYLYTYEISQALHLHIHILINQEIEQKLKEKLLKDWNDYNKWSWYNKRSLLIKNYNEYDIAIIDLIDLEYRDEKKKGELEKEIENAWILLNYMTKDILDIEKVLKLNYILYPLYILNGSVQKETNFDIIIKALQSLYKKNIYEELNKKNLNKLNYMLKEDLLENPFLENIEEKEKLNYIYNIWKKAFEAPKTEKQLLNLFSKLKLEEDLYKKQVLIEEYIKNKQIIVNELKLYNTYNKDFIYWNELLILKIQEKIKLNEKDYKFILNLESINNTIYYVLESLVKLVRYFKKEFKLWNIIEIEDLEFSYTEAYFKTIIREMYIINIIHKNLINYQHLYEKQDKEFLIKMEKMIEEIKLCIQEKQEPKIFYIKYQKEIESNIALWIDLILEILYEIQIIQKVNEVSLYIADKRQNYFILSALFIEYILGQEYTYEIILPLLIEPKNYEMIDGKVIGGYYTISNILFSKNENLKYKISSNIINIINQNQRSSLAINEKYLNYILNSKIKKIQKFTNLNFDYYIKHYIDKSVEEMKSSQEMYLIYEFFLSLYIAEFYKKQDFWFISKLDERGRKYDVGYPLNFYRDKILRNLFVWNREQTLKYIEIPLLEKIKQYEIYKNYIKNIHKDDEYNIFHILESPLECLVGFDAKNQIYQIIGGLIKDKKLLKLSKVIKDKQENEEDLDIYTFFLERLKKTLLINVSFQKLILNQTMQLNFKFGIVELLEKLDRTWIKDIVMTYGYNKSTIELITTTDHFLFKNVFNGIKYITKSSNIKKNIKEISVIIITTLINDINKEVKTLSNLKIIFNSLVVFSKLLKSSIHISLDNKQGFSQYYLNIENITFQKWRKVFTENTKKGYYYKKINVIYPKINEEKEVKKLDFKKNLNALLPNTCHYLDSLLLYQTIARIIELKIPIKTIHDSFYTNIKYKNEISKIYREEYINIFKVNVLQQIIQNALNDFLLNKEFFELMYKINEINKQNIPFTSIKEWKLLDKKQLKELQLNDIQKKLYECLVKLNKNYMLIYENELMQIDFEKYCQENKNEQIIL